MEFSVNGADYMSAKLSAIEQFHVFRKLAPVLGAVGSLASLIQPSPTGDDSDVGGMSMDAIMPLVHAISDLPEADCNMILDKCLSVVKRGSTTSAGTAWANVWSSSAKRMMFDDIDNFVSMIQIAVHVIQDNLGNFSSALPSGLTGSATQGLRSSR